MYRMMMCVENAVRWPRSGLLNVRRSSNNERYITEHTPLMTEIEFPSSPLKAFKPSFWAVCKQKAQDIASCHVFGALQCYWRKPLKRRANPALGVDSDKQQNRPPVAQSEAGLMSSHTRMHQRYT